MKARSLAVVAITLLALCWLDTPKAQAWGYRGVGWGRGWGVGWGRPWGWGVGWGRPWGWSARPWGWGVARPWWGWGVARPWWGWGVARPWWGVGGGFVPYGGYYGGSFDSYCPPGYGAYVSPPSFSPPWLPSSNGTYVYNGSVPYYAAAQPATLLKNNIITVQAKNQSAPFPAYGQRAAPVTTAKAATPSMSYPAYGEQSTPVPVTVVSNSKR